MAFQVRRLLARNAARIEAAPADLREVTKVLAELKPDNVEAQEAITNARIQEIEVLARADGRRNRGRAQHHARRAGRGRGARRRQAGGLGPAKKSVPPLITISRVINT